MLEIRKKSEKNFWHYYKDLTYSANNLRIEFLGNTVKISRENGAFIFLKEGFNYTDVKVFDDTASGVEETFSNIIDLENRLIALGYYWNGQNVTIYAPSTHNHDERYYTEQEVDTLLQSIQNSNAKTITIEGETFTWYPLASNLTGSPQKGDVAVGRIANYFYPNLVYNTGDYQLLASWYKNSKQQLV